MFARTTSDKQLDEMYQVFQEKSIGLKIEEFLNELVSKKANNSLLLKSDGLYINAGSSQLDNDLVTETIALLEQYPDIDEDTDIDELVRQTIALLEQYPNIQSTDFIDDAILYTRILMGDVEISTGEPKTIRQLAEETIEILSYTSIDFLVEQTIEGTNDNNYEYYQILDYVNEVILELNSNS